MLSLIIHSFLIFVSFSNSKTLSETTRHNGPKRNGHNSDPVVSKLSDADFLDRINKRIKYQPAAGQKSREGSENSGSFSNVTISGTETAALQKYVDYTSQVIERMQSHRYTSNDSYEKSIHEKFANKFFYIYNLTEEFWLVSLFLSFFLSCRLFGFLFPLFRFLGGDGLSMEQNRHVLILVI
jgi:hypothetical protein